MSANSLNSMPITPFPDPPSRSGEEPEPVTGQPIHSPAPLDVTKPPTSSADDLSLLLAQSAPDPYLAEGVGTSDAVDPGKPRTDIDGAGSASSLDSLSPSENVLDITFSPSPHTQPASHKPAASSAGAAGKMQDEVVAPRISWPLLLVSSYASALTLALGFILWTGWGLSRPDFSPSSGPVPGSNGASPSRGASLTGDVLLPLPAPNVTDLGRLVRLGELEVTPRSIARRSVRLLRLQGTAKGRRVSSPTLVMILELANRSTSSTCAPLDPAIVRDPVPAVDQSFIEVPGGRRIAMFRMAIESEWSIRNQDFPALEPGELADTILVSEPVAMSDLTGTMIWHVKLRTAPYRTDVLGVRFMAEQVANESE
ncbi:MAG: hypothetical protein ACXWO1_06805 [Isosphaeraceae bacterium]